MRGSGNVSCRGLSRITVSLEFSTCQWPSPSIDPWLLLAPAVVTLPCRCRTWYIDPSKCRKHKLFSVMSGATGPSFSKNIRHRVRGWLRRFSFFRGPFDQASRVLPDEDWRSVMFSVREQWTPPVHNVGTRS